MLAYLLGIAAERSLRFSCALYYSFCIMLLCGIFIFAAIPFSIAGFGTREAGSLFFLVYLNLPFEQIVAGSIVFGLTAYLL